MGRILVRGESERRRRQDDHRREPGRGLAKSGARTLLVDLDPQCNATSGLGRQPTERHPLVSTAPLAESSDVDRRPTGLELLPGSRTFATSRPCAAGRRSQVGHAAPAPGQRADAYDFVLIDCPPSLGQLTRTALASSTEVLMPIQCEYFAMEGLTQMIEVIRQVMQRKPNRLQFGGIVLTMYDHTLELTARGRQRGARLFRRDRVSDRHPARRGGVRGAQPRAIGDGLRSPLARGPSLRGTVHGGTRT